MLMCLVRGWTANLMWVIFIIESAFLKAKAAWEVRIIVLSIASYLVILSCGVVLG